MNPTLEIIMWILGIPAIIGIVFLYCWGIFELAGLIGEIFDL